MQTTYIRIRRHIMRDGERWQVQVQPEGNDTLSSPLYQTRGQAMTYLYQYTVAATNRRFELVTEELRAS